MQRLLGVAFAMLLVGEVGLLVAGVGMLAYFPYLLWQHSPVKGALAVVGLVAVGVALWKAHRAGVVVSDVAGPHPGISISRFPISGLPGALYMLQFLVWALVTPAVGLFYAALIAGALLLLPLIFFLNRPGRRSPTAASGGAVLGMLCGLAAVALGSSREVPLAAIFGIAAAAGVCGAPILIWMRARHRHVSIAPYSGE